MKNIIKLLIVLILATQTEKLFGYSVVLCYHKVGYSESDIYTILPELLEEQIKLIKKLGISLKNVDFFTNFSPDENVITITFDDGRKLNKSVLSFFEKERVPITLFINPSTIGGKEFFSWKEIKELSQKDFVIIGSHSYSHLFEKNLNRDVLINEVVKSKNIIEKAIDKEVFAFAYPFGIADSEARKLVSRTYKLGFEVNERNIKEVNNENYYRLPRYVIHSYYTLGKFLEIVDKVFKESKIDHQIYELKGEVSEGRLYKFGVDYPEHSILVIPSLFVGASWFTENMNTLRELNTDVWVFESEIFNFPFYKYEILYPKLENISLESNSKILKEALEIIISKNKNFSIIAWGDGTDLILHTISENPKYQKYISKLILINPSMSGTADKKTLKNNIAIYKELLKSKEYELKKFKNLLKIFNYLHLAYFKPQSTSPFNKKMSNLGAFKNEISKHIDYKTSITDKEMLKVIKQIEYSPLNILSLINPTKYFLDINTWWYNNLENAKGQIEIPTLIIYNQDYTQSTENIKKLIPSAKTKKAETSTLDIILSEELIKYTF